MGPEIVPGSGVPLAAAPGGQGFAMGLAVPGLTVPWGHAGYLWLATAASIAVHEVSMYSVQILDPCPGSLWGLLSALPFAQEGVFSNKD